MDMWGTKLSPCLAFSINVRRASWLTEVNDREGKSFTSMGIGQRERQDATKESN